MSKPQTLSTLIWSVADLLRGDYKPSEYGRVILPFIVLRRLDCVLAPTKARVLEEKAVKKAVGLNPRPFLLRLAKVPFVNTSPFDLKILMGDQGHLAANLAAYVQGFSPAVRDILERFRFAEQTDRLQKCGLLSQDGREVRQLPAGPGQRSGPPEKPGRFNPFRRSVAQEATARRGRGHGRQRRQTERGDDRGSNPC